MYNETMSNKTMPLNHTNTSITNALTSFLENDKDYQMNNNNNN